MLAALQHLLVHVFGPDNPAHGIGWGQMAARAALVYAGGLLVIRLGKKRLLGRTTAFDIILGVILGSLLSRAINGSASLVGTFVAALLLVALHWLFGKATFASEAMDELMKGRRRVLIEDGRIVEENLRAAEISRPDLEEALRLAGQVDDPAAVRLAYLERNGRISVLPRQGGGGDGGGAAHPGLTGGR